jgi:TQO small subunit DoxD
LIVGLFSRLAAFGIALTMVGAVATVHFRYGLFLNWFGDREGHGYEYHLLAIALALVVIVKGAGAFSVDRLIFTHEAALQGSQPTAIQKTSQKNMMSQPLQGSLDFIEAAIWPTQFSSR